MFSAENQRIPTYYPQLDEFMNGGLPPYTLSVICAAMHSGKSNLMVNMATRQMMHGHSVMYLSLEMAEDELAKRVDAQLTKLDINRIYDTKKKEFLTNLKNVKTGQEGRLLFKQFPTGTASVNDFRSYLYELQMRNINIDCIYVDYLNIMKPTSSSGDGNLYTDVKKIGEELRALTYIFKCPCVTATQTTRCLEIGSSVTILSDGIEKDIEIKNINYGDAIKTDCGFNVVTQVFPIEKQKTFKVILKDGNSISCSNKHLFPAYDKYGNFIDNMNMYEIKSRGLFLMTE
jgi:replicative DNA helicase